MKKRIFITLFLSIVVVGCVVVYYVYNKPHRDVQAEKAALVIEAKQLFDEYIKNEQEANKKYLDKVISVKGTIKEITPATDAKSGATIVLETDNEMLGVNCGLNAEEKIEGLQIGKPITIKGLCTGMTMDVVLNKCSIQKN